MDNLVKEYRILEKNASEIAHKLVLKRITKIMNTKPWLQNIECGCIWSDMTKEFEQKCKKHNTYLY